MEKLDLDDHDNRQRNTDPDTYVSCYPNSRRYSMASAMATNRPSTAVTNRGYNHADDDDDDKTGATRNYQRETKIEMPSSQPPQYSPAYSDKSADKRIKVSTKNVLKLFWLDFFSAPVKTFSIWQKLSEYYS